ncbi:MULTISPECIES: phage virion morphogenesis protein [Leisingera]|jgi:phage virion morphogenesis protein|uniref:phage virion morphogenesis protein n=1 Tax=Leisingera TaxID=191028 RepID=UPI00114FD0E6|nr:MULTISPECIES: phage virion morphogenesis protein [Leisingera]QDI75913.1 phage virion morphogenesis protein [Leisingera aquaemixtae]
MAGVSTSLTTIGLDAAIRRLSALEGFRMAELADDAGAVLEISTRRRFDTRLAPDGAEWAPWSEAYDETRDYDAHSLLVSDGDLRDSIASYATGSEVEVGTALIYGAHHQFGGEETGSGIPARPYLGISRDDELDLADLVTGTWGDHLA